MTSFVRLWLQLLFPGFIGTSLALGLGLAASAAGSVASGVMGSKAAGHAADTQSQAAIEAAKIQAGSADKALQFQKDVYGNNLKLSSPYYGTGVSALANLANLMGIPFPADAKFYSPESLTLGSPAAANTASRSLPFNGGPANPGHGPIAMDRDVDGLNLPTPLTRGGAPSTSGTATNAQGVPLSSLVNPALGQTGDLMKPFTWQGSDDPAYMWRVNEGAKLLQNSAAAKGNLLSGGTAKALDQYGQDMASNEYMNSFNRYRTTQTDRFNRLAALSNTGQVASGELSNSGTNAGNAIAQILLNSGNNQAQGINNAAAARASGYVGGANAWSGLASSMGGMPLQFLMLQQLMNGGGVNGLGQTALNSPW